MIKFYHLFVVASLALAATFSAQAEPAPMTPYVGDTLFDKEGNKVSVEKLNGKYVGLYFSASWCGPCRRFTPELQAFHKKFKKNFEVVLIGADRNERSHFKYMTNFDMDWLSAPFKGDITSKLNRKFQVSGIPSLVLIDPDGKVLTRDGRSAVMESKAALQQPGDTLTASIEGYMCGRCTKEHKRLVLKATPDA